MVDLSFIIVSYNTKENTKKCLLSIFKAVSKNKKNSFEIITIDNASYDESSDMLEEVKKKNNSLGVRFKIVKNSENLGFSKATNQGARNSQGRYILFVNSDVLTQSVDFEELISYLDSHKDIAVLTVRANLVNGELDAACHRGFPTLWRSFCYFLKLEKIFRKTPFLNRIFGGYHLVWKDLSKIHDIDSPSGAFYMVKKDVFDSLGGFDEGFFMYGEDLDLSLRIKQTGKRIIYYPKFNITHLKYQSGIKSSSNKERRVTKKYFYESMRIFYDKHYAFRYPVFVNKIVYMAIQRMINTYEKNWR